MYLNLIVIDVLHSLHSKSAYEKLHLSHDHSTQACVSPASRRSRNRRQTNACSEWWMKLLLEIFVYIVRPASYAVLIVIGIIGVVVVMSSFAWCGCLSVLSPLRRDIVFCVQRATGPNVNRRATITHAANIAAGNNPIQPFVHSLTRASNRFKDNYI